MRKIPLALRIQLANDPFYKTCARKGADCDGRITFEHAWIYASQQINERWAILPLCVYHHLGSGLKKRVNQILTLARAAPEDLAKYPRKDWHAELRFLLATEQWTSEQYLAIVKEYDKHSITQGTAGRDIPPPQGNGNSEAGRNRQYLHLQKQSDDS